MAAILRKLREAGRYSKQPAVGWQLLAFGALVVLWPILVVFNHLDLPHGYTCRVARRVDGLLWSLRGKPVRWLNSGGFLRLYVVMQYSNGQPGGVEAGTHFPAWFFVLAAELQNRWPWTRLVLDA